MSCLSTIPNCLLPIPAVYHGTQPSINDASCLSRYRAAYPRYLAVDQRYELIQVPGCPSTISSRLSTVQDYPFKVQTTEFSGVLHGTELSIQGDELSIYALNTEHLTSLQSSISNVSGCLSMLSNVSSSVRNCPVTTHTADHPRQRTSYMSPSRCSRTSLCKVFHEVN